jgi:pimeloyl-ACP methyl ester carboxylesterase
VDAHEGRSIEVNGAAVYVEQHGSGTPVVLIHGGLISSAMWAPLLPALRDGLRVIEHGVHAGVWVRLPDVQADSEQQQWPQGDGEQRRQQRFECADMLEVMM